MKEKKQTNTEAKHLLDSKKHKLESQESELFLKFMETYPDADACYKMLLSFLQWLEKGGYLILDTKRMVRLSLEID